MTLSAQVSAAMTALMTTAPIIAAVTAGMAIVTATAATFELSDNYSAPIGAESTIEAVFGGENMNNDYSRDEVRRILNTTPEQAEADALFNEIYVFILRLEYGSGRALQPISRFTLLPSSSNQHHILLLLFERSSPIISVLAPFDITFSILFRILSHYFSGKSISVNVRSISSENLSIE